MRHCISFWFVPHCHNQKCPCRQTANKTIEGNLHTQRGKLLRVGWITINGLESLL